jgi:hypothetical protein
VYKTAAQARGLTVQPTNAGEYVSGTLVGSTNLASGRYAMLDDGLGFSLVPWHLVVDWHITGDVRGTGIDWDSDTKLGLGQWGRLSKTEKQIHPLRLMKIMPDARGKSPHL